MRIEETTDTREESLTFDRFGLNDSIMRGIREAGFKMPSPIQQKAIPVILSGADLVGQAHTGTGKTAAFGLPILNMLQFGGGVEILVITPTRELAGQISDELYRLGRYAGVKTATIYGGQSYSLQIKNIRRGVQAIVATPGRLIDMLESKKIKPEEFNPAMVVFDEADEMLDMGFLEDMQKIVTYLPEDRQTLLFSATMPPPIQRLAKKILREPVFITAGGRQTANKDIEQHYYVIEERERDNAVIRLLDSQEPVKSIIFCRTKKEVERIDTMLVALGHAARGLHGDMEQSQREEVIRNFRSGTIDTLVATDVAARGLDVLDVSHVFNYHIPFDPESYVHRIGRTARAGRKGVAITLVTPLEFKDLRRIQKAVGTSMLQSRIPTGAEVRKGYISNLLHEIQYQPINPEAVDLFDALVEEIDLSQITYKLISFLLERQTVSGPDRIGISDEKLKKILSKHRGGDKRKPSRRKSGGRFARGSKRSPAGNQKKSRRRGTNA